MKKVDKLQRYIEKLKTLGLHREDYQYIDYYFDGICTNLKIIDEYNFLHIQRTINHLKGFKLSIQSVIDKTGYFIQLLKNKGLYRENYDYSKLEYIDSNTPITIINNKGLEIYCSANTYLYSKPLISNKYIKTTKQERFLQLLKDKNFYCSDYIYCLDDYKDCRYNIKIIDENKFIHSQIARYTLEGMKLSINTAIDKTAYFIFKAKELYSDRYDYSETVYIDNKNKVKIFDKKNDKFIFRTPKLFLKQKKS